MSNQQTVYIEPDEEITSVVDKIIQAQGDDLALIIPRGSLVNQSILNLKLIQKTAEGCGKALGIVSSDSISQQLAHRIGLTVYDSAETRAIVDASEPDFQKKSVNRDSSSPIKTDATVSVHHFQQAPASEDVSQVPDAFEKLTALSGRPETEEGYISKDGSRRTKKILKILAKVGLPILILAGLYFVIMPRAEITLSVTGEPIERELSITVDPAAATVSSDGLLIPGELVEVTAETTQQFPATGKKNIGEKATGKVTVSNRTGEDVTLPNGTRFKPSTNLLYMSVVALTVKAAIPKIDASGNLSATPGQATVEVTAEFPGEKYNISSTTSFVITDLAANKQDKVTSEASSIQGGSTKEVTIIVQSDIDNGKKTTRTSLDAALKEEATKKSNNKLILDGALSSEITDEQVDHNPGDEGNEVGIKLKGRAKAIAFSEPIFRNTFAQLVKRNLPDNQDIVISDQDELTAVVQSIDFEQKKLVVRGKLKTRIIPKFDQNRIKKQLTSKKIGQASEILKREPQVQEVNISVNPRWYTRMPLLASRITIKVNHD